MAGLALIDSNNGFKSHSLSLYQVESNPEGSLGLLVIN